MTIKLEKRTLLSTLWIFAVLNYLYADVMSLMDPALRQVFASGQGGPFAMTPGFLFGAAVLMETAIIMVPLSRLLPFRANKIANVVSGLIHTLAVGGSLFVGKPAPYYLLFAAIEIACTILIIVLAIRWREVPDEKA
jgi:hypothetical protein